MKTILVVALSLLATMATAAPRIGLKGSPLRAELRRLERQPVIAAAMAELAAAERAQVTAVVSSELKPALRVQTIGRHALLLTAKGFKLAKAATWAPGDEAPRYNGTMWARGWHPVYKAPLLSLSRSWQGQIDIAQIEASVAKATAKPSWSRTLRDWNPVTGLNQSSLVLMKNSLFSPLLPRISLEAAAQ